MGQVSIDEESVTLIQQKMAEEAELNAMRHANMVNYKAQIQELERQITERNNELSGIQDRIDQKFKEREDALKAREDQIKLDRAEVDRLNEEARQIFQEAEDAQKAADLKNEEIDALGKELISHIVDLKVDSSKIMHDQERCNASMLKNMDGAKAIAEDRLRVDELLKNAQDREAVTKVNLQQSEELLENNIQTSQALTLLTQNVNQKMQEAQDIIKKIGPRWITREV